MGKLQWGCDRLETTTPFQQTAKSLSQGLIGDIKTRAVASGGMTRIAPSVTISAVSNASIESLLARNLALTDAEQRQVAERLGEFNPLSYIEQQAHPNAQHDPIRYRLWQTTMLALASAGGDTWIKQRCPAVGTYSLEQLSQLKTIARCSLERYLNTGSFPDIGWSVNPPTMHTSTREAAASSALRHLTERHTLTQQPRWALAAERNGLDFERDQAQIERIENRLFKLGVWLDRTKRKRTFVQVVMGTSKSPFRSLKKGLLKADSHRLGALPTLPKRAQGGPQLASDWVKNLTHLSQHIEGSSRLRLFNGSRYSVNTHGVSVALSGLLTAGLLRLRLAILGSGSVAAGLDLGMNTHSMELGLFSQHKRRLKVSLGAGVGTPLQGLELGAAADVRVADLEKTTWTGVVLRLPRKPQQDSALRKQFSMLINDLARQRKHALYKTGDLLKHLFEKYPELSISELVDSGESKRVHGISAEAGISVGAGPLKAAAVGQIQVNYTAAQNRRSREQSGILNVKRNLSAQGLVGRTLMNAELRLPFSVDLGRINAAKLDLLGVGSDFLRAGRAVRRELLTVDGSVQSSTYIEVEYRALEDYVRQFELHRPAWIRQRALDKQISEQQAEQDFVRFFESIRTRCKKHHSFAMRAEIRREVRLALNTMALKVQLLESDPSLSSKIERVQLKQFMEDLLSDANSYLPKSLRVYERNDQVQFKGLRLGIQLESLNGAEGTHTFERLN